MALCGSCGKKIKTCSECGGLLCIPSCPDRSEDGCLCDVPTVAEPEETAADTH